MLLENQLVAKGTYSIWAVQLTYTDRTEMLGASGVNGPGRLGLAGLGQPPGPLGSLTVAP